jgi:hypothetical protein
LNQLKAFSLLFALFLFSCGSSQEQNPKIKFNLDEFTNDGQREMPKGVFNYINYEFCIPANDETLKEVQAIDSTVGVMKGSKGRSGCTDKEWLCIGSSRQAGFRKVIEKLATVKYIRQINETFWE